MKLKILSEKLDEIRLYANIISLRASNLLSKKAITSKSGPVISLTTHGKRIDSVHLTIETIAQGNVLPSRIMLWIDDISIFNHLPENIVRLVNRGLEVLFCENFGPHTKYYPYLESIENPTSPLVTADDDVLYPKHWLEDLERAYKTFPNYINCYRARNIKTYGDSLSTYTEWLPCTSTNPSYKNFGLGVSGIIYPPEFQSFLKSKGREFLRICPKADDIWLHVNAVRSGYRTRQLSARPRTFPEVPGSQDQALFLTNQLGGENDKQISKTYTQKDITTISRDEI